MLAYKEIIDAAFEIRNTLTPHHFPQELQNAITAIVKALDRGTLRVAEYGVDSWVTHTWIKKALMLYFKLYPSQPIDAGFCQFFDKVPLKYRTQSEDAWRANGVRVAPGAIVRAGAYIAPKTVLMPCFINIGAYVDEEVMVDAWATVGSCAQIGKRVHLSGGVGIGGVLEPVQATPTIIEDDCFIGARSEIVEGVIVERGSVISMGVYLGQSTKIYDRATGEITKGKIPAGSVVVPGSLPAKDGSHSLACAIIVKKVDAETRAKVSINDLLRA